MGIIYCYTNKITGKKYIGQTVHPRSRKSCHLHEAIKRNSRYYFHRSIRKHGWENFEYEILEETDNLGERETFYIKEYNTLWPHGYNEILMHNVMPEETKKKISETKKRQWKEMSAEEQSAKIEQMRQANLGRPQTEKQKSRAREANQSQWNITHPDGRTKVITNLRKFCHDQGLGNNGQSNLTRGSYKGYKAQKLISLV
jgi:group I intron endonuclease